MDAATMETAWAVESRYGLPLRRSSGGGLRPGPGIAEVLLSESPPDGRLRIDQLWVMNPSPRPATGPSGAPGAPRPRPEWPAPEIRQDPCLPRFLARHASG